MSVAVWTWNGAGAQASQSPLVWALGVSLVLHAGVLFWRWNAPEHFERVLKDSPLQVILVNARSEVEPEEAQLLAQHRLTDGGDVTEMRLSSSPLPSREQTESGDALQEMQRQIEVLKTRQMQLLTQVRDELARLSSEDEGEQEKGPDAQARAEPRRQLSQHLAQIDSRVQQTQKAPRERYIGPATREAVYSAYCERLRDLIELRGTENFPQANDLKLYGQLTMGITIDHRGQLQQLEIIRTSGQPRLDEQALDIVRSVAPFDVFEDRLRRQADQIVVISRFVFARDKTLQTQVMAPSPAGRP